MCVKNYTEKERMAWVGYTISICRAVRKIAFIMFSPVILGDFSTFEAQADVKSKKLSTKNPISGKTALQN